MLLQRYSNMDREEKILLQEFMHAVRKAEPPPPPPLNLNVFILSRQAVAKNVVRCSNTFQAETKFL